MGESRDFVCFQLHISFGCVKIRYIIMEDNIMTIGNEEEEYAAGGGSERALLAGRGLRRAGEGRFGAETRKRRYVLSCVLGNGEYVKT